MESISEVQQGHDPHLDMSQVSLVSTYVHSARSLSCMRDARYDTSTGAFSVTVCFLSPGSTSSYLKANTLLQRRRAVFGDETCGVDARTFRLSPHHVYRVHSQFTVSGKARGQNPRRFWCVRTSQTSGWASVEPCKHVHAQGMKRHCFSMCSSACQRYESKRRSQRQTLPSTRRE